MIQRVLCLAQLGSCILCLLVLFVVPRSISASTSTASASASSSSANYNAYHYDRARHFTPDGRLLQVEYAMAAAEQSSPLVVCQLDRDTLVVLSCSLVSSSAQDSTTLVTTRPKPQDRIVILEDSVVVAMSGLLADSVALLKTAFQDWQDYKSMYCGTDGTESSGSTMLRVLANSMGKSCHDNCFQGGIRPYGATMLLLSGPAQDGAFAKNRVPCSMFQTDPPGAVTEIISSIDHDETENTVFPFVKLVHMVGGSSEARTRVEKAIGKLSDKKLRRNSSGNNSSGNSEATIWERIQELSQVLVDEQLQRIEEQKKGKGKSISERLFGRKKKTENEISDDSIDVNDDSSGGSAGGVEQPWLEAVVISRTLGIHKLTSIQIQQLLVREER